MSVRWMSEVWKCALLSDSRRVLVALSLADWANDDGICWPSIPMVAKKSRVSRASVFRYLKEFEALGIVSRASGGGKGNTTCYRLNFAVTEVAFALTETVSDSDTVSNDQTVSNGGANGLKWRPKRSQMECAIRKNHHNHHKPPVRSSTEVSPVFILLPLKDNSEHPIHEVSVCKAEKLYPALDVRQQFRSMRGWLESNPSRRKTAAGIMRFCNSWLSRASPSPNGHKPHNAGEIARQQLES